jgi:16S rRNA (cytosine1402-N4)-methyltransferase
MENARPAPAPNRQQHFPSRNPRWIRRDTAPAIADDAHQPIMVDEVLRSLQPMPGELAVDCTLGSGGHALALLEHVAPGGRLIGFDVDRLELPRAEARLLRAGSHDAQFVCRHGNFADVAQLLTLEGIVADVVLVDLGVSELQLENPARGFSYKIPGPLDMRMDTSHGRPASELLARLDAEALAAILRDNADEPHADLIASILKTQSITTTHAAERLVRTGLQRARPDLTKSEIKVSLRRTFQALRIAVNDELTALDRLLESLPRMLAPGGRVAILTFHSGEDRRVKRAFQAGQRAGVYADVSTEVVRSKKKETFSNRKASAAKLRWAVRISPDT